MKVCIDAGHGGRDPGARGRYSKESELNLAIALNLEEALEYRDYETIMTRRTDRTLSLASRAAFANRFEADLFISVHCNAGGKGAHGMETWIFPNSRFSRPFARSIISMMSDYFPRHRNRGVKEANFQVLRETAMAAVLVECEFLSTPRQERFLNSRLNQLNLAESIATGIDYSGGFA